MNHPGYNNYQQQQHSYGYDPSQIPMQPYDQSYAYQQYYAYDPQYAYFPNAPQSQFHYQSEPAPLHPPGVNPTASEPPQTGPSQYKGKGGRGGRPFRGGGRGRGHGRGHGGGGGRHIPSHSSGPSISNVPGAPAAAGATLVIEPSSVSAQTPLPKPTQAPAAPLQPPVPARKACCEICKVECNTPEILEQHKNGKKHKKKMKMHEQLQICNTINGQQSEQISTSQLNLTDQPKEVLESEKNGHPAQNMGSGIIVDNHKEEIQLQNNAGNISEVPAEVPEEKTTDNSPATGRGLKRKKKGGKGGKYMRTNDGSRPVELPKPAQPPSLKCELCDVKCESQAVYQSHMAGKKHLSRLKRAQNQASSGVAQPASSGVAQQASPGVAQPASSGVAQPASSGVAQPASSGVAQPASSGVAQPALAGVAQPVSSRVAKQPASEVEQAALSGGFFGLQALYPPDINALSNAINAQVQQGDNDPQVLLAQLLMTVLSQAQVPATAPGTGAVAALIPAPTSVAGSSFEPQLQTQGSEIPANVEKENPSGEPKTEQMPVPLGSNAQPGSGVSSQIEGGSSETKNKC